MARQYLAITAETILLILNAAQLLLVLSFFWGGQASDNVYIYANVFQASVGALLFVGVGGVLLAMEAPFDRYCHLIPLALHVVYHMISFTVAHYALSGTHTVGELTSALALMIGASIASTNVNITYLHNA